MQDSYYIIVILYGVKLF